MSMTTASVSASGNFCNLNSSRYCVIIRLRYQGSVQAAETADDASFVLNNHRCIIFISNAMRPVKRWHLFIMNTHTHTHTHTLQF